MKINLGTGEQILSELRLRMDDLTWHLVELYHVNNNVFLVIDKRYETIDQVVAGIHNFTFHHGIYIGSHGGLSVPYLDGKTPNFRGCMEDVVFNQKEVLASLRSYPGFKKVYEVSLGCNDEFFAGENEAINFFSSRSYVIFPEWRVLGDATLRFAVQTGTQQALLLFQSGSGKDFVALEIHEGLLKAHVRRGETKTQLPSFSFVSDNKWHIIQLRVTRRYLYLMVDEQRVRTSLPLQSRLFVSEGPLFMGGLNHRMREAARRLELASVPGKSSRGVSLKGCLTGLEANSEKRVLRDALVSKDISAGCRSENVDHTHPSVAVADPLQPGPSPSAVVPSSHSSFLQDESGSFLVLNNLEVQEGGRALLGHRHIDVNVKVMDLHINYSQILLKIQEPPAHGSLQIDVWPEQEMEKVFTMLDLRQEKMWYVHDGSEEPRDSFTFFVFSSSQKLVPSHLQDHVPHVLNIIVILVNDPPHLKLPEGNLLLLFENSKKRLTQNMIQVSDPDSDSPSLGFSVLSNFNSDAGFVESAHDPGRAINSFTYMDLQDGNIFYVDKGHGNSRLVLRPSIWLAILWYYGSWLFLGTLMWPGLVWWYHRVVLS